MKGNVVNFSEDGPTHNLVEPQTSIIERKENIIENLMLRYDLDLLPQIPRSSRPRTRKDHEKMRAVASEYECLKKAPMLHFEKTFTPMVVSAFIRPLYSKQSDFAQNIRSLCISYYNGFVDIDIMFPEDDMFVDQVILNNYRLREKVNELRDCSFHLRNEVYQLV